MFSQAGEVAVEAGQSVVQDFAPGVARGAISAVGSQIEGVELGFAADIDSAFDKLNRIDLGESIAPQTPAEVEWLTKYKLGSDQDRENIRSSLLDKRMAAMHEGIGKSVREYGVETFPSDDPAAFSSKVGEAFGSSVPMLIEGYLGARGGRAVGGKQGKYAGSTGAVAMSGTQLARSEIYNDAVREGEDPLDALEFAMGGDIIGASEAVPIAGWARKLDKATGGKITSYLKDIVVEGSEEVVQELGSSLMKDLFAKSKYDSDREVWVWSEKGEEAGVAFSAAALMSTLVNLASGRRGAVTTQQELVLIDGVEIDATPSTKSGQPDTSDPLTENLNAALRAEYSPETTAEEILASEVRIADELDQEAAQ
ncbi:MAG: hypothetical protein HN344_10650, partial [Gammaproteobacteria bacterium]|nr:hypothetical protein [Gammaproteobacteria bacterium]